MATSIDDDAAVARTPNQPWCDLGTEIVVLRARDGAYYRMEASSRSIWLLLEEPRTLTELTAELARQYAADRALITDDLRAFVERCAALGLVTLAPSNV